ncbi:type II secretion system F family protein [Arthrobacter sp. PsM3]|uniref:type II secretion system F family protein n=1 Tax=Arthrobacter sp. PsM3 TaxID=3030531 RepID=UPI00263B4A37|nr:type II secretion system F family protein [Arthrobacter sp. PsM3]MDN4642704.1 type II secretion system F family protein [Arthrobacter sp. PsM3]
MLAGAVLILLAVALGFFVAFRPRYTDIHVDRRRPPAESNSSMVSKLSGVTVAAMERRVGHKNSGPFGRDALGGAGLKLQPAEFAVLVLVAAFILGLAGYVLQGWLLAVVFAGMCPVAAKALISFRTGRRRAAFEAQLSDMLMSLSGSLRAGHSIAQSMRSASVEMSAPMGEELARIVNEDRVGRPLSESMAEVGLRLQCEDFQWLSQAIEINREVGGDLAGVLDHVADTVRERAQIKGQIRALAAEGKFSAYILIALPFFVAIFINLVNPGYMAVLTETMLGWLLMAVSVVMMAIGSFWISRMVKIAF